MGRSTFAKFHWKPKLRPAVGGVERGGQDQRRRPRLPPPGPVGRHHRRRLPRVGARAAAVRRRLRRPIRLRHPGPDQDHPGGGGPGPPGRPPGPGPGGGQLLRRDRAGGVLHAERRPRHRFHQRPAAAGPELLLPGYPAQAAGRPQLHPAAGKRAQVPGRAFPAGRAHGHGQPAGPGQLRAELLGPARPAGGPGRGLPHLPRRPGRPGRAQAPAAAGELRRPLQPGAAVLRQPVRGRAAAHHRRVHLRAQQVRSGGDPDQDGGRAA